MTYVAWTEKCRGIGSGESRSDGRGELGVGVGEVRLLRLRLQGHGGRYVAITEVVAVLCLFVVVLLSQSEFLVHRQGDGLPRVGEERGRASIRGYDDPFIVVYGG